MTAGQGVGSDMFGQERVTVHDVFAWLLCVPRIDPASAQAANYVRGYDVLEKIARAKSDGSFDDVLAQALQSARFLQLVDAPISPRVMEDLLSPRQTVTARPLRSRALKEANRPKEVIRAEKARKAAEREARKTPDASMLCRLPAGVPSLGHLLSDIGNPSAYYLGRAMHVSTEEAARWIAEDHAPRPVMLSLFWLTRWGTSIIDAEAQNAAAHQARLAAASRQEAAQLRTDLAHVERIADFGSANDPLPTVQAHQPADHVVQPAASSNPAIDAGTPEQTRRAKCAA